MRAKRNANALPTSGNFSILHLSSKSFHGVFEDKDILDGTGDGLKISKGSFTGSFIKIYHQEAFQDSPFLQVFSWRTGIFLMELEMVSGYSKYPREALL